MTLANGVTIGAGTTVALGGESTFAGPGSLVGTGKFQWTGGTIDGNLDVGSNLGTMTMRAGTTVGASVCCVSPDHVTNRGSLIVAAGPGNATITNLAFSNGGTVKITGGTLNIGTLSYQQTAGVTQLAGGSLSAARQIKIAGGTLSGFGTIAGSVLNGGVVSPSSTAGVLKISGAYTQTSTGELMSVITGVKPGTRFGRLQVGGKATLSGTLHVSTGGGFTPKHGQAFAVLVCHSRGGTFAKRAGRPAFKVGYGATAVKVIYP